RSDPLASSPQQELFAFPRRVLRIQYIWCSSSRTPIRLSYTHGHPAHSVVAVSLQNFMSPFPYFYSFPECFGEDRRHHIPFIVSFYKFKLRFVSSSVASLAT